jgi:RNA methyltransferase, TrmH family
MLNTMRSVSSRQNPIVAAFRDLAADAPLEGTRLLLDGEHLVTDARAAGLRLASVAVTDDAVQRVPSIARLVNALDAEGVDVVVVTTAVMAALSPVRTPSGVAAIVDRVPTDPAALFRHPAALLVAPTDVQDPGNVGAIVRAAEALGATGVFVCGQSANPFSWKALRGSMGSVLRMPVGAGRTPDAVLQCARRAGARAIASVPRGGDAPADADWSRPMVLFVGGEGPGLAESVIDACDARVTIPMQPPVESLNVAVSTALLLYEARRQRAS